MGKGSSPRPFSVSQEEYGDRFETIFGKKNRMTPHVKDNGEDFGTCGCGRSPSGDCCGYHALTEEQYQQKLREHKEQLSKE